MIDTSQELKLKLLKVNLSQDWNLDNKLWNEEFNLDYRFQDTYLQLSYVFSTFSDEELRHLITLTNSDRQISFNVDLIIEIDHYINSCVDYINYELKGNVDDYFKKYNKNTCFSFEKKIKNFLKNL